MTLKVNASDFSVILNICEGPDRDIFTIPSRCEVIRYFKVSKKISSCEDQVIHPHEIMPGVLFARSIFNPEKPFLRVMNLTNDVVKIKNAIPKSENLSNYDVYSLDDVKNADSKRNLEIARLVGKGVPEYVKSDLVDLCMKFSDVFALSDDKFIYTKVAYQR